MPPAQSLAFLLSFLLSPHPMLPYGLGLIPWEVGLSVQSHKATTLGSTVPRVHKAMVLGLEGLVCGREILGKSQHGSLQPLGTE